MNYWKISILSITLIVLAGSFYWFQYLPHKVQKDCSDGLVALSARENNVSLYDKYFDMCITSGGYSEFKAIVDRNKTGE